ncbi:MAG: TfoX/Sxy family protein [candidate division WOR-3 bacterium]|nr:MAG: TfoX/Sxy family protein [candidate division WOR-3 bacterium]
MWKKTSKEVTDFLSQETKNMDCEQKKMFGCPVFFINGNMFMGAHEDNIFLRLPEKDRTHLLSTYDETRVFEPIRGRIMREYIVFPENLYHNKKVFNKVLKKSVSYVSSLPPKRKKRSRRIVK